MSRNMARVELVLDNTESTQFPELELELELEWCNPDKLINSCIGYVLTVLAKG